MKLIRSSQIPLIFSFMIWLVVVGAGVRLAMNYENASGKSGDAPSGWPVHSRIVPNSQLPTLIMMVHPRCPCSRASVSELAILMSHQSGLVNAEVVFVKPADVRDDWTETDLWKSAAKIPGVLLRVDDGTEARRFGALTSGQVMLYSANGHLLFSGGMTSSRGHEGENDGRRSIQSILASGSADMSTTPVFGCPLFSDVTSDKKSGADNDDRSN